MCVYHKKIADEKYNTLYSILSITRNECECEGGGGVREYVCVDMWEGCLQKGVGNASHHTKLFVFLSGMTGWILLHIRHTRTSIIIEQRAKLDPSMNLQWAMNLS